VAPAPDEGPDVHAAAVDGALGLALGVRPAGGPFQDHRGGNRQGPSEGPHWYLFAIGVDPGHQGAGVGAALLRERLRHIDIESLPAYLESSSLANVPMYEHFGFENTGTVPLPEDAPVFTSMWRTPQQGSRTPGRNGRGETA
jgi:ribosomal protein S18 acetylase RimI-like enzyme